MIAELAARQYGVVARWQLLDVGLGGDAVDHRVRIGRLHRVHRCVYAVGAVVRTLRGTWMAAVLACGPEAVVSHTDAGRLHGLLRGAGAGAVHVTVPRGRKGCAGIRVHRVRRLDPRDRGVLDGIPVTSLPRTLLDLAEVLPEARLARAIEEAERQHVFDLAAIDDVLHRSPGKRGRSALGRAVAEAVEEACYAKSDFERDLLDACRDVGAPPPALNVVVEGEEVDAHWPGTAAVLEMQSWEWHRTRRAFERDHAKALKLEAAGYRVVRVTSRGMRQLRTVLPALLDSSRTRPARGRAARARAWP